MEPPDPFPNSEVKRLSADGSVVCPCESRSSSAPYLKAPLQNVRGLLLGYFAYVDVKLIAKANQG